MILRGYILSLIYVLFCIALSTVAYKLGLAKRYTRKIVHILVGFEWVILYHFFGVSYHFLLVCVFFTLVLFISYKKDLMPMMQSDSDNAPGTFYYGLSMTVMCVVCLAFEELIFAFGIAVVATSVGDGFAGVFGALISPKIKIYKEKTLFGSIAAFVFTLISVMLFLWAYGVEIKGHTVIYITSVAVLATGLELIGSRGLDNIILPLGIFAFSSFAFLFDGWAAYLAAILLTPFVIVVADKKRLLSRQGIVLALVLDLGVSLCLGSFGFVLLLAFLIFGALIDKIKHRAFYESRNIEKRSGARDTVQVLANGAIPLIFAILHFITGQSAFVVAYTAALAEAFADTAASGFGSLSKGCVDILRLKPIAKGLSGGISLVGTLASLAASLLFPLIALAFGALELVSCLIAGGCAFMGVIFDSLLGSLLQVKFKCRRCGIITEREEHCGAACEKYSGVSWMNNDLVNLISTLFAAGLSLLLLNLA